MYKSMRMAEPRYVSRLVLTGELILRGRSLTADRMGLQADSVVGSPD